MNNVQTIIASAIPLDASVFFSIRLMVSGLKTHLSGKNRSRTVLRAQNSTLTPIAARTNFIPKIITLFLILSSNVFADSTGTVKIDSALSISNISIQLRELQSGRPTNTSQPVFIGTHTHNAPVVFSSSLTANAMIDLTNATPRGWLMARQYISSTTANVFVAQGSAIPADNTIPQINEGYQVLVATITPLNAASTLYIEANVNWEEVTNNCSSGGLCLFTGNTANAVACVTIGTPGTTPSGVARLSYAVASASTASRNYSIRIGCEATNTIGVNTQLGAAIYGGSLLSSLRIMEIQ